MINVRPNLGRSMYICLCHGITESDLEQAARRHKRKEDVLSSLGLGQSCGICLSEAIDKLNVTKSSHNDSQLAKKREQKSTPSN